MFRSGYRLLSESTTIKELRFHPCVALDATSPLDITLCVSRAGYMLDHRFKQINTKNGQTLSGESLIGGAKVVGF